MHEIDEGDILVIDKEEEEVLKVYQTHRNNEGEVIGYLVELTHGEWYIFGTQEAAGQAARDYWRELAENDPEEFRCIVGDESLVKWALGQYAGPGSTKVNSLEAWLDLWLDTPEECWASYDRFEWEAVHTNVEDSIKQNVVAYRWN